MLHLTDLDPASVASVPPEEQELLDRGVNRPRVECRRADRAACNASGWTEDHRRCLAIRADRSRGARLRLML